jgi:hypothetical protein
VLFEKFEMDEDKVLVNSYKKPVYRFSGRSSDFPSRLTAFPLYTTSIAEPYFMVKPHLHMNEVPKVKTSISPSIYKKAVAHKVKQVPFFKAGSQRRARPGITPGSLFIHCS